LQEVSRHTGIPIHFGEHGVERIPKSIEVTLYRISMVEVALPPYDLASAICHYC
jgi:hypothetical protein